MTEWIQFVQQVSTLAHNVGTRTVLMLGGEGANPTCPGPYNIFKIYIIIIKLI